MTTFVGVDPDTKSTGIAIIFGEGEIRLRLAEAKGRLMKDRLHGMALDLLHEMPCVLSTSVIVIEWQHIRRSERNPNSMMGVQAVAGMALAAAAAKNRGVAGARFLTPLPSEWKGSVPKEIHQQRILKKAGLTHDSIELRDIPVSKRQHVIDALGMALWAKENYRG